MTEDEKKKALANIKFTFQQPGYIKPVMKENRSQDYITWTYDNKQYPDFLLDLAEGSSLHGAILRRMTSQVAGKGLFSELNQRNLNKFIKNCNADGESLDDIWFKCVRDFITFDAFALQVVYGKASGKIAEIYYKDISTLRFSRDQKQIKEAENWSMQRVSVLTHDRYNPIDPTGRKIFYYRGTKSRTIYPKPEYCGALSAIQADILIADFWLAQVKNGLFPGLHIHFSDGNPTPEVQDALERDLQAKFGGNPNAGRMFITFGDNQNPGPTIQAIPITDLDKQFVVLNDSIQTKIFQGSLFAPALLNSPTPGKLGVTNEITQAFQQYTATVIDPIQCILLKKLNNLLSVNFEDCDLNIIQLKPIGNVITDQVILSSQMTPKEIRKQALKAGWIDQLEVPEGETVIGDIAVQKVTDRNLLSPEQDPQETNKQNIPGLESPGATDPSNDNQ